MKIGIAGRSGSGKDSIGKLLASKLFYETYAYANPLKELCAEFIPELPWYGNKSEKEREYFVRNLDFNFQEDFGSNLGLRWDVLHAINIYFLDILENKEVVTAREILQYVGTEIVRNMQGRDFWVDLGQSQDDVVITDVRFLNELVDFNIKLYGGVCESGDTHESEVGIDDSYFDLILVNEFSEQPQEQLQQLVDVIMEKIINGEK